MTERWSYWNGPDAEDRRIKYAKSFKEEYQANGDDVQRRIDAVLVAFKSETGIELPEGYASGWRSPSINEGTKNAAKGSSHLTAQAGDKRDSVDGQLCWWCFRNLHVLEQHGLWTEHPVATVVRAWKVGLANKRAPTPWCHLQTRPVGSPTRAYWPDTASIKEWDEFTKIGGYEGITYNDWCALQLKKGDALDDV